MQRGEVLARASTTNGSAIARRNALPQRTPRPRGSSLDGQSRRRLRAARHDGGCALRATLRVTTSNDKSQILEGKRARATCCRACAAAAATRTRVVMADGALEATARMAAALAASTVVVRVRRVGTACTASASTCHDVTLRCSHIVPRAAQWRPPPSSVSCVRRCVECAAVGVAVASSPQRRLLYYRFREAEGGWSVPSIACNEGTSSAS